MLCSQTEFKEGRGGGDTVKQAAFMTCKPGRLTNKSKYTAVMESPVSMCVSFQLHHYVITGDLQPIPPPTPTQHSAGMHAGKF